MTMAWPKRRGQAVQRGEKNSAKGSETIILSIAVVERLEEREADLKVWKSKDSSEARERKPTEVKARR